MLTFIFSIISISLMWICFFMIPRLIGHLRKIIKEKEATVRKLDDTESFY